MKRRSFSITLSFLFCLILVSSAHAAPSLTATLDEQEIGLDDDTTITVSVSGVSHPDDPSIPRVPGLTIVQSGRTSQVQIINGDMSMSVEYIYTVVADAEGEYKIPPFSVFAKGVEYKTNSLTLKVAKNSYATQPQQLPSSSNPPFGQTSSSAKATADKQGKPFNQLQSNASDKERFRLVTSVNNHNPYLGEQILFSFKIYTRENISQSGQPVLPDFKDFMTEIISDNKRGTEVVNGVEYATWEKVIALMPLKEGVLTLSESSLDIVYEDVDRSRRLDPFSNNSFSFNFGGAFATQKRTKLKAPAFTINVKSLPQPVPADFTGLVGDFGVQTLLSSTQITQGDSVTYEVQISGKGNIKNANLPALSFPDFKVYYDKPQVDVLPSTQVVSGKKTFKIALVPERAGEVKIPPFTLSYFDPQKGAYTQLNADEKTISVLPAKDQTTNAVLPSTNQTGNDGNAGGGQEIRPIVLNSADVFQKAPFVVPALIFYLVVIGFPFGLLIFVAVKTLNFESVDSNKKRATKKTHQELLRVLKNHKSTETEVLDVLRNYISALFGVSGQALTAQDMRALCLQNGVSVDVSQQLEHIASDLETSQYALGHAVDLKKVKGELEEVVRKM